MASVITVSRTCGLILLYFSCVLSDVIVPKQPWIVSFKVHSKSCVEDYCKYLLNVKGGEYLGHLSWRLTPNEGDRGGACDVIYPTYELNEVVTAHWLTRLNVTIPNLDGKIYFCLFKPEGKFPSLVGKYVHQGGNLYLDPKNDRASHFGHSENLRKADGNATDIQKATKVDDAVNDENNQIVNLQEAYTDWADLTHDTDVNYLSGAVRPNREETKVVEVLNNSRYTPLYNNVDNTKEPNKIILENDTRNVADVSLLDDKKMGNDIQMRRKRDSNLGNNTSDNDILAKDKGVSGNLSASKNVTSELLKIEGLRIELSDKEPKTIDDGVPSVLADTKVTIRLFGQGLTERTVIMFTYDELEFGKPCKLYLKGEYLVRKNSIRTHTALFDIVAPPSQARSNLYICAKTLKAGVIDHKKDEENYYHQGIDPYITFATHDPMLPLWVSLCLICSCLCFSALFSGLNLGLMSLDRTELKIISNTGTEQERKYARAIMPVRDHGNYLLCSILLGNVAVNSTFTILLDELTSGLYAVIFSTLSIVLLGEITPQAICSRHGLMVGAKSIMVTKAVMALTAPLSYPVSKLLDYFLGEEIGSVYNRERLKELVKVTTDVNDLDNDEVNIISGALELRKKTVSHVMTTLEDVFMLPITSVLDFETMSEIIKSGFSRIPVYEGKRINIITVLFIKDLAFVDPDDNTPLRTLCQYYQNPCNFVFEDVTLDVMFRQFKEGHKGHMAFVHRINNEGEGDPFYETIGLVTLEDVIEELIQAEIMDETDVFMDNRSKRRRNRPHNKLQDFTAFAERHENQRIHISPQLTLATFQFLSTSVDDFRPDHISENVLRRLLRQDVIHHIKLKGKDRKDPSTYVFQQGKSVDYFVLILEGRVEVTVGRENLVFEAGPFTFFGVQALATNVGIPESPTPSTKGSLQNVNIDSVLRYTFVPDYSVRAITEVFYLTVKRSLYLAAKRATLMEKGALSKGATNEQFDTEVDKNTQSNQSAIELMQINPLLREMSRSKFDSILDGLVSYERTSPECHVVDAILDGIVDSIFRCDNREVKKKKTSFRSSTSLVSLHSVSPETSHHMDKHRSLQLNLNRSQFGETEYNPRFGLHSQNRSIDLHCDQLLDCNDLEFEHEIKMPACDRRMDLESKFFMFEADVISRLDRILTVLEGRDPT